MLARLGLAAALLLAVQESPGDASARTDPLAEPSQRAKLRTLGSDVARTGELDLVHRMGQILAGLGEEEAQVQRLARDWERLALAAKPGRSTRAATASKVRRELEPLVAQLPHEPEPRRSQLAHWILALDSDEPEANAVLGRERNADGAWLGPEERLWDGGAREVARRMHSALALDFDFERGTSDNPALRSVGGGNRVALGKIELHSALPFETLERILRQCLRAAALSQGVLLGRERLTKIAPRTFVLPTSEAESTIVMEEALANGGLNEEYRQQIRSLDLRSYFDRRGWETFRCLPEAGVSATILWRLLDDWVPVDTQPCLRVGHLNWLCLGVLGTGIPLAVWVDDGDPGASAQRSTTQRDTAFLRRARWRLARQRLWGCRAWMVEQVREGRDPPWARAMLDQDGKIRDEPLLKTTLVCEMLQQEGELRRLMEATKKAKDPVSTFETALGRPLPELEERWRRWIDPGRSLGIVQVLEREPAPAPGAGPFDAALLALNQARANGLKGQSPEFPIVVLDAELSRAAALHARYLTLNPEQKGRWPDCHAENADARGFSVEGALAGSRSVIAFNSDPLKAVQDWLGTFYHRLPLLDPGLFGVGFGQSEEVIVVDTGSLVLAPWKDHVVVWPVPDDEGVPRSFVPELPNPVPAAEMASLGYPITVQLFFLESRTRPRLELELFKGALEDGEAVDAWFIAPDAPLQVELAPENAWALIPKRSLARKTRYTARAAWGNQEKTWSFTTGD